MLDKLFLEILNMSFTASIVIIFILIARLFLKKVPKIYTYVLWAVVLIRLLVPFSIESILSLMPVSTKPISHEILYSHTPTIHTGVTSVDQFVSQVLPAGTPTASVNPLQVWIFIAEVIWVLGMVVLLAYGLVSLIVLKKKLYKIEQTNRYTQAVASMKRLAGKHRIYVTDRVNTPFVLGIMRPKIYLPLGLGDEEAHYILLHEQIHIKRCDHIIRLISFILVCIHWFNPFIWVAFFLAGKDMEMSCDEAVIRTLGHSIKKHYSTSLLSFAMGKSHTGLIPLAFGESSTKSRVKNILNYKKPSFWVVGIILMAGILLGVGLLTNPIQSLEVNESLQQEENKEQIASDSNDTIGVGEESTNETAVVQGATIEACAEAYLKEVVEGYSHITTFKIMDSKITALNKIVSFDHLINNTVELWAIEYRLKPDRVNEQVTGTDGVLVDGWLTEDGDMGKPVLAVEVENGNYTLLGEIRSGYIGTTLSSQEIAMRQLLEQKGRIEKETYEGQHIVVKFPLSNGETCKLLLSQPAKKGKGGIWCVERWLDGGGSVYYDDPGVNTTLATYYEEMQAAYDKGEMVYLVDTQNVALKYTNKVLGQILTYKELELIEGANLSQFYELPISTYFGYVTDFKLDMNVFNFDRAEWVTSEQVDRIKELGISKGEMPNGFYIYNPKTYLDSFIVDESTMYSFSRYNETSSSIEEYTTIDKKELYNYLQGQAEDYHPPFWVETRGGYVTSIREQYIP